MLELLNQLDGFSSDTRIKVIAATNRVDILDPALLRSGRIDRKIEFPMPSVRDRQRVLEIHSRRYVSVVSLLSLFFYSLFALKLTLLLLLTGTRSTCGR